MNRIHLSKEARQSLQNARLSIEKDIREAKTAMHQPGGDSEAQSRLVQLKKEATLIYSALAARRGKLHSRVTEDRFEALKRKYATESLRRYMSPAALLIAEALTAPAQSSEVQTPVAA